MESLIPFGLHQMTDRLVDVADVPRGAACDCICPSCKTPLLARQGNEKQWHFSHQSRQQESRGTENACDYSFEVSVRLMIRQLATNRLKFRTPRLTGVTDETAIELVDVSSGTLFSDTEVDVQGYVNGIPLAVYVTYYGRGIPAALRQPTPRKSGVVEINLRVIPAMLVARRGRRYADALRAYLEQSTEGKSWAYHPRRKKNHNESADKPALPDASKRVPDFDFSELNKPREPKHYECRLCGSRWFGVSRHCDKCDASIYTAELSCG